MKNRAVRNWLFIGLVLVFFQIVIGGITRLTESGLSITKWEVVAGTFPPLSNQGWLQEFEQYKLTPQYKEINEGMTLSDFKFIYFWEYLHRLWARWMGIVFLIPFIYFYKKGMFTSHLLKRLGGVVALATLAACFGWIMVASGLVSRPWVNAYKLSIHLIIAICVFGYLLWTFLEYEYGEIKPVFSFTDRYRTIILTLLWIQLVLGGIMSGMKAGLYFPTWPKIGEEYIPHLLFHAKEWNVDNFIQYDTGMFAASLFHFLHRGTAYLIFIIGLYYFLRSMRKNRIYNGSKLTVIVMLVTQVLLGIITVILCKGEVPVWIGVLHQIGAILLFTVYIRVQYLLK
jgi:heme a synthase